MSDDLAKLSTAQVAGFYGRLADQVDQKKGVLEKSLAATLMRQWLANRDPKAVFTFDPPSHLIGHSDVIETLKFHRAVYLTEKQGRFYDGKVVSHRWAGLIPRLQGRGHAKWNGIGTMSMEYQCLVQLPLRYQVTGSDADRDLLYALHDFQLKTNVSVTVQAASKPGRMRVAFAMFQAKVLDRYDWDYTEHLKVPNPDFGSKSPGAVLPESQQVQVYHSNAKRVEDAGLAAPFNLESTPWTISDLSIMGTAEIDPNKSI